MPRYTGTSKVCESLKFKEIHLKKDIPYWNGIRGSSTGKVLAEQEQVRPKLLTLKPEKECIVFQLLTLISRIY